MGWKRKRVDPVGRLSPCTGYFCSCDCESHVPLPSPFLWRSRILDLAATTVTHAGPPTEGNHLIGRSRNALPASASPAGTPVPSTTDAETVSPHQVRGWGTNPDCWEPGSLLGVPGLWQTLRLWRSILSIYDGFVEVAVPEEGSAGWVACMGGPREDRNRVDVLCETSPFIHHSYHMYDAGGLG
jgi:hypothetical protein